MEGSLISFNELEDVGVPHTNNEFGLNVDRNGHYKMTGVEIA
jgi:hypothetical protein